MAPRNRVTPTKERPPFESLKDKGAQPRFRLRSDQLDTEPDEVEENIYSEKRSVHKPMRQQQRAEARQGEGVHTPARTRRRRADTIDDPFHIPQDEIPEGLSYEWKRWTVAGLEDPFYIANMRSQGWEPVHPRNHPNWVPPGYSEPHIIKGGQILMERPIELTREAQEEMRTLARRQIRDAESRLGKADSGELARERPQIVKEYVRPIMTAEE